MTRREFASLLSGAVALFSRTLNAMRKTENNSQPAIQNASTTSPPLAYRDANLPIGKRVADLLQRMTLEEKVEQLRGGKTSSYGIVDPTGKFTEQSIQGNFRQIYEMHSRLSPHDQAVYRNALRRFAVEKTRLGIPQIFQDEGLHGFTADEATSFPQSVALASTWDPELIERVFTAIADEAASAGINQIFAPVLDVVRDPRWGRTEETYGEDLISSKSDPLIHRSKSFRSSDHKSNRRCKPPESLECSESCDSIGENQM